MVRRGAIEAEREWYGWSGFRLAPYLGIFEEKMKTKRLKLLTREAAEKQVHRHIDAIRKIRGFVNVEVKATVRVSDARDPNAGVLVQAKYA